MYPKDIFIIGDRVQVHGEHTKHHGRIARITNIGDLRLTVDFEDKQPGKYVHYTDAVLIPERGVEGSSTTPPRLKLKIENSTEGSGHLVRSDKVNGHGRSMLTQKLSTRFPADTSKPSGIPGPLKHLGNAVASIIVDFGDEDVNVDQLTEEFVKYLRLSIGQQSGQDEQE